jgi:hypothetical protein
MSIFDDNMSILQERYPALAQQIRDSQTTDYAGTFRVELAASGAPTLIIEGVAVHSTRDPVREGQRLADTLTGTGAIVVLGLGFAYAAVAAVEKLPDCPLIVVERHIALLKLALETRDLRRLFVTHPVIMVLGEKPGAIYRALQYLDKIGTGKAVEYLKNRTLVSHDAEWYAEVERHIQTWVSKDAVNRATLAKFGTRWVRNLSHTITTARDVPGIRYLEGILAGTMPVLLVAAGPSLDDIAPFLPDIADRCVIVAVDTALRFLSHAGVEPDFAVVVDPQYWNARHLDRTMPVKTCLITEAAVYSSVFRHPFERIFVRSSLFPLGYFLENRVDIKGSLGSGGSVATTAWDFSRVLGASAIWITGLDLSFPALKTHFKGALFEERALSESTRLNPVETWHIRALRDGKPFWGTSAASGFVLTDRRLSLYAAWFENQLRQYPQLSSYRLFAQGTKREKGLAIPGMKNASIDDILALPLCRVEKKHILSAAFAYAEADFNQPEHRIDRASRYRAAVQDLLTGLEQVQLCAEQTADAIDSFCRKKAPFDQDKMRLLAVIDRANQAITGSTVKDVAGFLFPAPTEESAGESNDPFTRYVTSCKQLYRPLADAVCYNRTVLTSALKVYKGESSI